MTVVWIILAILVAMHYRRKIWVLNQKLGWFYPPNHPFVHRVFHYKPSILGENPLFLETPILLMLILDLQVYNIVHMLYCYTICIICNRRILTGSFQFTCHWKYQDSVPQTFIYSVLDELHHPGKMKFLWFFRTCRNPPFLNIPQLGRDFLCLKKIIKFEKKFSATHHLTKNQNTSLLARQPKKCCSLQWSFGINSEFFPVPVLQENPELPGAFCKPPKTERDENSWRTQPFFQNLLEFRECCKLQRFRQTVKKKKQSHRDPPNLLVDSP